MKNKLSHTFDKNYYESTFPPLFNQYLEQENLILQRKLQMLTEEVRSLLQVSKKKDEYDFEDFEETKKGLVIF